MATRSATKARLEGKNPGSGGSPGAQPPRSDKKGLLRDELSVKVESIVKTCLKDKKVLDHLANIISSRVSEVVMQTVQEMINKEVNEIRKDLGAQIDELEQYGRRNAVRVFGIPEIKRNKKDGPVKFENTDALVLNVFKNKLNLNLSYHDISRSHRVGKPRDGRPRPIIVKFVSYRRKREVFSCKKKLKGTDLTITEDLTAQR